MSETLYPCTQSGKTKIQLFSCNLKKNNPDVRSFEASVLVVDNVYHFDLTPVTNRTLDRMCFKIDPGCLLIYDSNELIITGIDYPRRAPYYVNISARRVL